MESARVSSLTRTESVPAIVSTGTGPAPASASTRSSVSPVLTMRRVISRMVVSTTDGRGRPKTAKGSSGSEAGSSLSEWDPEAAEESLAASPELSVVATTVARSPPDPQPARTGMVTRSTSHGRHHRCPGVMAAAPAFRTPFHAPAARELPESPPAAAPDPPPAAVHLPPRAPSRPRTPRASPW